MEKTIKLKDGQKILVREMQEEDTDPLFAFFARLPAEDRKYLRSDVTQYRVIETRFRDTVEGRARRIIAIADDEIVADGALELKGHGWGENIAEIRLIVGHSHQRQGLGSALAKELYFFAAEAKVDRIVARLMRPQVGAHLIMKKLGFQDEFLIPEHVRDQDGVWQDMIIMRCNLEDLWRELEGQYTQTDWRSHR